VPESLAQMFDTHDGPTRGWLPVLSECTTGAAYLTTLSGPAYILVLGSSARNRPAMGPFAVFVFVGGAAHAIDEISFWWPMYLGPQLWCDSSRAWLGRVRASLFPSFSASSGRYLCPLRNSTTRGRSRRQSRRAGSSCSTRSPRISCDGDCGRHRPGTTRRGREALAAGGGELARGPRGSARSK
jgi:hypothetical protein